MQSTNQKCNPLASVIGLFLHSTSTPELVIEMLAHCGLSISPSSIHTAVSSLSVNAQESLRHLFSDMCASFVYDNFDMDFKSWQSSVDGPGTTLIHATSAFAFPLMHGTTSEDLDCAQLLWATDPRNPAIPSNEKRPPYAWANAMDAKYPHLDKTPLPTAISPTHIPDLPHGPSLSHQILAWHFRNALVNSHPPFNNFHPLLGMPESILQIPITKTTTVPCRAMDINQSTQDGQADILDNLFMQANIGDPHDTPGVRDIGNHVILVHGDLGTGERLQGVQMSRRIEATSARRIQHTIFVMGLFYLQMAAADAIWRMFIEPKTLRNSPTGLYQQACAILPHDTGRIGSKPGFRLMHDIIQQCTTARMLDCWHTAIIRKNQVNQSLKSLDDFALTKPSWITIEKISHTLVKDYLNDSSSDNVEFNNNSIILQHLLQYMELTHAIKYGDIGRVEAMFIPWAFMFKAVGKHKYAAHLFKAINDLHYVYPPRLRYVFLVNVFRDT